MIERVLRNLRKASSLSESKGLRAWLVVATILGLASNIIVLIGCVSPVTRPLYLYRFSSERLAEALQDLSGADSTDLEHTDIPREWYWGMSGFCAVYDSNGRQKTSCQQAFPPMHALPEVIEISLESVAEDEPESEKKKSEVLKNWTDAIEDAGHPRRQFLNMTKASAALAVMSLIVATGLLAFGLLVTTERWKARHPVWTLHVASLLDGAMFLASGITAVLAMNSGPRWFLESSDRVSEEPGSFLGPGMYVLFAGACLKLAAVGLVLVVLVVTGGLASRPQKRDS